MPSNEEVINIKLVEQLEKFPILYHYKLDRYSKRDSVEAAWENIANAMNDTDKQFYLEFTKHSLVITIF